MMVILRLLIEITIAVALSLVVATSPLGIENYLVIGGILAIVGALLIYSTHGLFRNIDSAPTPIWLALTIGICVVLGALWPSLPFIFFYERDKTKRMRAEHQRVLDGNAVTKPEKP